MCAGMAQAEDFSYQAARGPVIDRSLEPTPVMISFNDERTADVLPDRARVRFGALDMEKIWQEDQDAALLGRTALRVGVNRGMPNGVIDTARHGQWLKTENGGLIWRMMIELDSGFGARVHITDIDLPGGSYLLLRGNENTSALFIEERGPIGDGEFWAPPLAGDRIFIEYQTDNPKAGLPTFKIDEISHLYVDIFESAPDIGGERGGGACSLVDVNCHIDLMDPAQVLARDSVGRYSYVDGGSFVCTGSLLNDADPNTFAGWFWTANHCVDNQSAASTVVTSWFYGTSMCGGSVPSLGSRPAISGATFLAGSAFNDYTFMRLNSDPDDGQGFNGATNSNPPGGSTVHMIHHPGGSWKRYSLGTTTFSSPICNSTSVAHLWDNSIGLIQGGSSGAPLFNNNWQTIGALTGFCWNGGQPNCNTPISSWNFFGPKISAPWTTINGYLSQVEPDDAYEDNDARASSAIIPIGAAQNLIMIDFDDWFEFQVCAPGTVSASATFDTSDMNADMQLVNDSGIPLDTDFLSGGSGSVSASVSPGTYYIRFYKTTGWGGDYTLTINAGSNMDMDGNGIPDECDGPPCPWDLNFDGQVGSGDLAILVGQWGNPYGATELAELLGTWGPCP